MSDDDEQTPVQTAVVKQPAALEPLFPEARLLKGAVLEADQALQRAREVEQAATVKAQALIKEAEQQAHDIRARAAAQAAEQVQKETQTILQRLAEMTERNRELFVQLVPRAGMELARAVLRSELTVKPAQLVRLVEDVAAQARRYENLVIRLHPADAAVVSTHLGPLKEKLSFAKQIQVIADTTLPRFEIRLDTEMGRYMGGLETALQRLENHVFDQPTKEPNK